MAARIIDPAELSGCEGLQCISGATRPQDGEVPVLSGTMKQLGIPDMTSAPAPALPAPKPVETFLGLK